MSAFLACGDRPSFFVAFFSFFLLCSRAHIFSLSVDALTKIQVRKTLMLSLCCYPFSPLNSAFDLKPFFLSASPSYCLSHRSCLQGNRNEKRRVWREKRELKDFDFKIFLLPHFTLSLSLFHQLFPLLLLNLSFQSLSLSFIHTFEKSVCETKRERERLRVTTSKSVSPFFTHIRETRLQCLSSVCSLSFNREREREIKRLEKRERLCVCRLSFLLFSSPLSAFLFFVSLCVVLSVWEEIEQIGRHVLGV